MGGRAGGGNRQGGRGAATRVRVTQGRRGSGGHGPGLGRPKTQALSGALALVSARGTPR